MGRKAIITGCLLTMTIFGLTACTGAEGQEPTPTPEIVQTQPTSEELSTDVNESEETETAESETTETVDPEIIVAAGPAADIVEEIPARKLR